MLFTQCTVNKYITTIISESSLCTLKQRIVKKVSVLLCARSCRITNPARGEYRRAVLLKNVDLRRNSTVGGGWKSSRM
jgi:hypothetical protein